jgi:hypothetical protein
VIELVNKDKELEIKNSFSEELNLLLLKYFKFLFIENNELYFVITTTNEEDKNIFRKNYHLIKNKCITTLNIKGLKSVSIDEEKVLFFQKAVEICNTKEVKLSLVN